MSSAARSPSVAGELPSAGSGVLSGPVSVCVDRPVLALDRPFTYQLTEDVRARLGSLVQVPFHGRAVRAWVLGPTEDVPQRMLPVRKLVSPVPSFDQPMLELLRWMRERYVVPLATLIGRAVPPRVASEEAATPDPGAVREAPASPEGSERSGGPGRMGRLDLATYRNGGRLLEALGRGTGAFVLRNAPREEAAAAVESVRAALASGRTAIVVTPEIDPVPATVAAIVDAFGDEVATFYGGDRRTRYRTWLEIGRGRYRVIVGTRPAVFAPVRDLGLIYVHREGHAQHRDERSPSFHVRDVARARAAFERAVCILATFCPSLEAAALAPVQVEPAGRPWAPVEVVRPGPEGRSPRLVRALQVARRAFLYEPLRGYGVARVCRACGEPAACASCRGMLRLQSGSLRCVVCEAAGRCASCGGSVFGIARGGAERVEEWARGLVSGAVSLVGAGDPPRPPADREVLVGGVGALKDLGPLELDLVGILNADTSLRRPGVTAREQTLVTWFEAAAWARRDGRVVIQTNHPNDAAVQALVAARPERFHRAEAKRRHEAGFPVGAAVFRVAGTEELEGELQTLPHRTLLASSAQAATICLVVLDAADLPAFGEAIRALADRGVVTRVEAEPHL